MLLQIISGDALKIDFPQFNLVVANIPYGISSPLLAKLVYGVNINPFRSATLLLQKEFARRLLAKPGDSEYNRLALNVKLVSEVEFVMNVSKRDFVPCPKVDSSVVKIYPKSEVPDVNLEEWWAFTRTCFSTKNKTLGAIFKKRRRLTELMSLSESGGFQEGGSNVKKCCEYDSNGDEDEDEDEDEECGLGSGGGISLFRGKIMSVLESGGFSDKRPSKLGDEDFLHLLSLFNEAGIYFRDRAKQDDRSAAAYAACDG